MLNLYFFETIISLKFSIGIQSLVLKWASYQHVEYNGYNYIRIRGDLLLSEDEKFSTVLLQSDDNGIAILIDVPSIFMRLILKNRK